MTDPGPDIVWQPPLATDVRRYALAALSVLALGAGAFRFVGTPADGPVAIATDDAILLDLPPASAAAMPPNDPADGPGRPAVTAASSPEMAAPAAKRDDEHPPPQQQDSPVATSPPEPAAPEPQATAQAAPAPEPTAPPGAPARARNVETSASEGAPSPAARAMARWQRAMLTRLEAAKAGARSGGLTGTVLVAFAIDRRGRLLSRRIVRGSESARLDQAALALLDRAAPFAEPPADADDAALRFTVPIAFARRH